MLLLGGLGLLLIAAGLLLGLRSAFIVLTEPAVTGTIARIDTVAPNSANSSADAQTANSKVQFMPMIQYQMGDKSYEIKGQSANNYNTYKIGQALSVRYNPAHPEQGQVDSFPALWLGPIGLIILGLPFAYLARATLSRSAPDRRQRPMPTA